MKTTANLENKDVRVIIARFLGVKLEDVIPNRYSFGVTNMPADEIERRIYAQEGSSGS